MIARARAARWAVLFAVVGCSRGSSSAARDGATSVGPPASSAPLGAPPVVAPALDVVATSNDCTFGHRGVLLDLGDAGARARLSSAERGGRVDAVERDGATWARIFARSAALSFVASADDVASATAEGAYPVIEARVRGGSARSIAVFLNGKAAGTLPLTKGETKVVSLRLPTEVTPNTPQLVTGTNDLLLRFRGAAKAGASAPDEEAEIDWVHVGGAKSDEAYAAPTRSDVLTTVTIGGVPMPSVSLRAPGYARCSGWIPAGGRLMGSVGVVGGGDADLELRMVRDRTPIAVLASLHLAGGAPWKPLDVPLFPKGAPATRGTLGAMELVAVRATRGARVVFGEPRIVRAEAPATTDPAPAPARGVLLVVVGNVAPRLTEPFTAGGTPLAELGALAKAGVIFDANRAASGGSSAALASMLTGLAPRAHGVVDEDSGLAADATTLADVARQAGIRAAMFTAVPTTGAAFGFARGWDTFVEHAPDLSDPPGAATAPFEDAARWIADRVGSQARFLAVVHARGGHPPWDATPEDVRTLPPPDYAGAIDPRRAAELLLRARPPSGGGSRPPTLRLNDDDRTRAWAYYSLALKEQDAALGRLLAALKAAGRDADTLVIVTGDVGLGEARAPLEDADVLSESALTAPLVVRFPGAAPDSPWLGHRVAAPTTSVDVARTVTAAFGLSAPGAFEGEDLRHVALTGDTADGRGRPMVAESGSRFSLRWGSFVLRGAQGSDDDAPQEVTKLCDVSLEPDCTSDVRGAFPLALSALRRELAASLRPGHAPVPVVETPPVRAALKLWGL